MNNYYFAIVSEGLSAFCKTTFCLLKLLSVKLGKIKVARTN